MGNHQSSTPAAPTLPRTLTKTEGDATFFAHAFNFSESQDYNANRREFLARSMISDATISLGDDITIYRERAMVAGKDAGAFSTPSVGQLRQAVKYLLSTPEVIDLLKPYRDAAGDSTQCITVKHVSGDSRKLHGVAHYEGAVIQAASQFNYLEFPSQRNIPENGIVSYVYDRTQGPACAIACAAGTAYRNYLAPVSPTSLSLAPPSTSTPFTEQERGQTSGLQFNGLADLELKVGEKWGDFFTVKNGYIDSTPEKLTKLNEIIAPNDESGMVVDFNRQETLDLIETVRIGVQQDTEVTDRLQSKPTRPSGRFLVTQTYNSAISVGYSQCKPRDWEPIARMVLAASYEATMLIGIIQAIDALRATKDKRGGYAMTRAGQHPLYPGLATPPPILLTKVGGGVFANDKAWIADAMKYAFKRVAAFGVPLNVAITHYAQKEAGYDDLSY